jgi:hypothetical protein
MCAGAILQSRMGRLVFGAANTRLGAAGSWVQILPDASGVITTTTEANMDCTAAMDSSCSPPSDHDESYSGSYSLWPFSIPTAFPASNLSGEHPHLAVESPCHGEEALQNICVCQKNSISPVAAQSGSQRDTPELVVQAPGSSLAAVSNTDTHRQDPADRAASLATDNSSDAQVSCVDCGRLFPLESGHGSLIDCAGAISGMGRPCDVLKSELLLTARGGLNERKSATALEKGVAVRHPFHVELQVSRGVCEADCADMMCTFFQKRRRVDLVARFTRHVWKALLVAG